MAVFNRDSLDFLQFRSIPFLFYKVLPQTSRREAREMFFPHETMAL